MRTVLIVENEPSLLESLACLFREEGIRVKGVTSSVAAINVLKQQRFDFVATDMSLEVESAGLAVVEAAIDQQVPVAAFSGHPSGKGFLSQARTLGAVGVFDKGGVFPTNLVSIVFERLRVRPFRRVLRSLGVEEFALLLSGSLLAFIAFGRVPVISSYTWLQLALIMTGSIFVVEGCLLWWLEYRRMSGNGTYWGSYDER